MQIKAESERTKCFSTFKLHQLR